MYGPFDCHSMKSVQKANVVYAGEPKGMISYNRLKSGVIDLLGGSRV